MVILERKRRLLYFFLITSLFAVSWSMLRPMMSLYLHSYGLSARSIGLILSLQTILPLILAMPIGNWIDRIGVRTSVRAGAIVIMISLGFFIISNLLHSYAYTLCGLIIVGVGSLMAWGGIQTAATRIAIAEYPDRKTKLIANFSFVNSLTQFAGPGIGGVLVERQGYSAVFLTAFVLIVLLVVLSSGLRIPRADSLEASKQQRNETRSVDGGRWRSRWFKSYREGFMLLRQNKVFAIAILMNCMLFVLVELRTTFFPIYLAEQGISESKVGYLLSIGALMTIFVRPLAAFLMDYIHNVWLSLICAGLGGLCLISLSFHPTYGVLIVIVMLWACATGANQPVTMLMIANSLGKHHQGMGMGVRIMANRGVEFSNPILFGFIVGWIGLSLSFAVMGSFLLVFGGAFAAMSSLNRLGKKKRDVEISGGP